MKQIKERKLKNLNRKELLEIILKQAKEIESLEMKLAEIKKEKVKFENIGSLAEASLEINHIFETCQKAADVYLNSIKALENEKKLVLNKYQNALNELDQNRLNVLDNQKVNNE